MLKVAITGNIASGKSTVEDLLKDKGYKVLDTDDIAHLLLRQEKIKKLIISKFAGLDILQNDELSRPKLGIIVFANEEHRKVLEEILHPLIRDEIKQWFKEQEKDEKIVFVSVPLLFEAKFENLFDKIVLIYADDEVRIKRLIQRNDLKEEMARNRLGLQMSQDKKKPLVGYILFNNGSLDDLACQVKDLEVNLV
jgi:dephospho-CoA kinase